MAQSIDKASWITAQACFTKAWLDMRSPKKPPDEAALFRMEQGKEVGQIARSLFPEGVYVTACEGSSAAQVTSDLTKEGGESVLFEAAFQAGLLTARADILQRGDGGWRLIEVKSSLEGEDKVEKYLDDIAFTAIVASECNLPLLRCSLLLLSREYRFGDPPQKLFVEIDVTESVFVRLAEMGPILEGAIGVLQGEVKPPAILVSACRQCDHFRPRCLGTGLEHTVLELPRLHHTKLNSLSQRGIVALTDLPTDFKLNEVQERVKYASLTGNVVVENRLREELDALAWPCYYLDFETVVTVMPLYEGVGCHQQLLTQFSLHWRPSSVGPLSHGEFLADVNRESERELAERLIRSVGQSGSIIVYSNFERTQIARLAKRFPDLSAPLEAINTRLVDLCTLIEKNFYHPSFEGSFSIKQVLPVLVDDLSYDGLAVRNGDMASTHFARMARGEVPQPEVAANRQALLEYCKMDTLAMVRLHEALEARSAIRRRVGGGPL